MKKKRAGSTLMLLGSVLIAAALLLQIFNSCEAKRAELDSERMVCKVQQKINENQQQTSCEKLCDVQKENMTCVEIEGCEYIGYLSIPVLKLELPIMSEWDYARLKIAPCRQFGSAKEDDLVIAGHNYRRHFGRLNLLKTNDLIRFVDMDGESSFYRVDEVELISPQSLKQVQNKNWELVLYTCNDQGDKRVVVGSTRIAEKEAEELLK